MTNNFSKAFPVEVDMTRNELKNFMDVFRAEKCDYIVYKLMEKKGKNQGGART